MFYYNGSLIFVPEHVVIVRHRVFMNGNMLCGDALMIENARTYSAVVIIAEIRDEAGGNTQLCRGDSGIRAVADSRNYFYRLVGNLICKIHAQFAVVSVHIAINTCFLDPDERVDSSVADGKKINFFAE